MKDKQLTPLAWKTCAETCLTAWKTLDFYHGFTFAPSIADIINNNNNTYFWLGKRCACY